MKLKWYVLLLPNNVQTGTLGVKTTWTEGTYFRVKNVGVELVL